MKPFYLKHIIGVVVMVFLVSLLVSLTGCVKDVSHTVRTHQESSIIIDEEWLYPDSI